MITLNFQGRLIHLIKYSHKSHPYYMNNKEEAQSPIHIEVPLSNNSRLCTCAPPLAASRGPCTQVSHKKNRQTRSCPCLAGIVRSPQLSRFLNDPKKYFQVSNLCRLCIYHANTRFPDKSMRSRILPCPHPSSWSY